MPRNKVVKMKRSKLTQANAPTEHQQPRELPDCWNIEDFQASYKRFAAALGLLDIYPGEADSPLGNGEMQIQVVVGWLAEVADKLNDELDGLVTYMKQQEESKAGAATQELPS